MKRIKKSLMSILGIPEIDQSATMKSERVDGIFLANLHKLEIQRQVIRSDLQYLESRHQFFMAVIEAGPYAIITSIVAVVWALANEESAIAPTVAIAGLLGILVVVCNRLDIPAEHSIVQARLNMKRIDERYAVREKEVEDAYRDYDGGKAYYFGGHFDMPINNNQSFKEMYISWLPERTSEKAKDMESRHPDTFASMEKLEEAALKFQDNLERYRKMVHSLMEDKIDQKKIGDHKKEEWLDSIALGLIYCMTHNIMVPDDIDKRAFEREINNDQAVILQRIFEHHYESYLINKELMEVASQTERDRISAEKLAVDIEREIKVLYGTKSREL